jgi:hypothetical protein
MSKINNADVTKFLMILANIHIHLTILVVNIGMFARNIAQTLSGRGRGVWGA